MESKQHEPEATNHVVNLDRPRVVSLNRKGGQFDRILQIPN